MDRQGPGCGCLEIWRHAQPDCRRLITRDHHSVRCARGAVRRDCWRRLTCLTGCVHRRLANFAAIRCDRLRIGPVARVCAQSRRNLEIFPVQLPQSAALDPPRRTSSARRRLANDVPAVNCCTALCATGGLSVHARIRSGAALGGGADLRHLRYGDRDRAQNLERGPFADQVGGAGAITSASPDAGAAEPDQSSFSIQHPEFSFLVSARCARHRARDDHQTCHHPAPLTAQQRCFCSIAR